MRLRLFRMDDLDAYHERIYNDADVMRYLPPGTVRPREDAERALEQAGGVIRRAVKRAPPPISE